MARGWDWEIVGYIDHEGVRHKGGPEPAVEPAGIQAVIVRAWDPRDEDDYQTMLVPALAYFNSWYEILSAIGHALAQYGIEMA